MRARDGVWDTFAGVNVKSVAGKVMGGKVAGEVGNSAVTIDAVLVAVVQGA